MAISRLPRRSPRRWLPLAAVAALAAGPAALTASAPGLLIAHEWGTFVSMEGSDGLVLEGLHHDEADLPGFVHSRPRDQLRLHATQSKLETPVIYFYPRGPNPAGYVNVRVDFPEGILTQWYPQASVSAPRLLQGDALPPLKGGRLEWSGWLSPDTRSNPEYAGAVAVLPRAEPSDSWSFARQTGAAFFRGTTYDWAARRGVTESEKFLFYRGLGRFVPPLRVRTGADGRVTLANIGTEPLNHLFLMRVEHGRGTYQYLPTLGAGAERRAQIVLDERAAPLEEFVAQIGQALGARLVEQGLFADEARAMVNTWSRSYFRTEGMRLLYLVPRAQIDRTLPLTIHGVTVHGVATPHTLERVFVGRVECLTPEEETRIEGWLRDLAAPDTDRAAAARAGLVALGRFAEPHLRRALQNSSDPAVRARAQRLLLGDALDELIAAEQAFPAEVDVAARLAALQRRAGLVDAAKSKGAAALVRLQAAVPAQSDHVARRKWLRSTAFAREAIGDPGPAAAAYGDWVRFAAGLNGRQCQGCHKDVGVKPLTYADLRDWWGGERFRATALAAGQTETLIAAAEAKLKTAPADPEALITLAYLLPARGDGDAANRIWEKLGAMPAKP